MDSSEIYKLFGPISITMLWSSVAFLAFNWRGDKSMTISKHAAAHKSAYFMMLAVQTIVFPMFILFVSKWLVPTFDLPSFLSVLTFISFTSFLIAAYIPDKEGRQSDFHAYFAYGAALLLIPALTILYLSPNISAFSRFVTLLVLIYQLVAMTAAVTTKQTSKYQLYFQVAYFLLFDVAVLIITYI